MAKIFAAGLSGSHSTMPAEVLTIIDVMTAGMTVLLVKNDTGMIGTGMIEQHTAGIGLGHPLAVRNMKIVAPGLRPPGGTLMIEGLQGTN
jgi:hypothetical protein